MAEYTFDATITLVYEPDVGDPGKQHAADTILEIGSEYGMAISLHDAGMLNVKEISSKLGELSEAFTRMEEDRDVWRKHSDELREAGRIAVAEIQSRLEAREKELDDLRGTMAHHRPELSAMIIGLQSRLDSASELRTKGRAAWEVLERYIAEAHGLDLNKMPGSDDMMIALTGIRFLPPTEADIEWLRQNAKRLGLCEPVVEKQETK